MLSLNQLSNPGRINNLGDGSKVTELVCLDIYAK